MPKLILSLAFLSILFSCAEQTKNNFIPTFTASKETTHKISDEQEFTFGYLEVLENRSSRNGKTIKFPVYIFNSRNSNPKNDPIIYTVGGPGSSTMSSAQYMNYYKYLDDRDFILIEQRGTYYSQPHLDCPEWSKAVYESNLPDFNTSKSNALFSEAAKSCRDRLINKGIDLNGYTTNEIAADINDLVTALDIEEYNLLTLSYSTKIAQVLLRDYPKRIRSVVMDSPLPIEVNYDEESVENLLRAIETLLSDCEANKDCNSAFPNIKKRFFDYLQEKTIDPLVITVENPLSKKPETFYLKGKDLITVFTYASTGDVINIPLEINKLLDNDLTSIKKQLSYLFQEPNNGAGMGMRLSVWCAEEHPFNSQKIIAAETKNYPQVKGLSPVVFEKKICDIWSVEKVEEIENQPIKSKVPILLISGEYDNETPVKWAESIKNNFTNSYHLIFKGWKHGPTTNWENQCAMQSANDFFNNPNVKPNPDCFAEITSPEFKTD